MALKTSTAETYAAQHRGNADHYATCFAGMDASMQQKVALTTAHFPTRGRVADMGSGSGRGTHDPVFPPESLDGVLDSSVLHHVTSFNAFSLAHPRRQCSVGGGSRWSCSGFPLSGSRTVATAPPPSRGRREMRPP